MNKKPYLDKISTSAHVPSQEGQFGLVSLKHFPDLSHTGIRSKFEKQVPYATAADGRLLPSYKVSAFRKTSLIERGLVKLNNTEDVFKTGHKQFIDKVLVDMESTKLDKHKRQMRHWNSGKSKLGFGDSFNSLDSGTESFANLPTTESKMPAEHKLERSVASPTSGDEYNDNDFEEHDEVKPITHTYQSKSDGHILRKQPKHERNHSSHFPEEQHRSLVNVTFSAMSEALPSKSDRIAPISPKKVGVEKTKAVLDRKPQPYNNMTLFNNLLETTPPPSPTKRFGSLAPLPDERF